MQKAHFI